MIDNGNRPEDNNHRTKIKLYWKKEWKDKKNKGVVVGGVIHDDDPKDHVHFDTNVKEHVPAVIDYSSNDVIDHYNFFEPLQEQDFDAEDVCEVIGAVVS